MHQQQLRLFVLMLTAVCTSNYLHATQQLIRINARVTNEKQDSFRVFSNQHYDSIVAFDIINKEEELLTIIDANHSIPSWRYNKRVKLSPVQAQNLLNTIEDTATYGQAPAACFSPHLAIAFYRGGKAITDVLICFDCNQLYSGTHIPATGYYGHRAGEHRLPDYGFSTKGNARLSRFCWLFGFGHCGKE